MQLNILSYAIFIRRMFLYSCATSHKSIKRKEIIMTEPLKPLNVTTYGGVKVDANRVAKFGKTNQGGAKRFTIDFKDGTRVEYPAQNPKNKSDIRIFDYAQGATRMEVRNMAYAKITGTPKRDDISMRGCRNSTVDVAGGGKDVVTLTDNLFGDKHPLPSSGNKVIQDKDDETVLKTTDYKSEYRKHNPGDKVGENEFNIVKGEGVVSEKDY